MTNMFDTSLYTGNNPQKFTEEEIKNLRGMENSHKTFVIELANRQEETNLRPEQCWWFPWMILRPFFQSKGYTLYNYDLQEDPGAFPQGEGPPATDSFGLYGDRTQMTSELIQSSLVFGACDRQNRDVVIKVIDKYSADHPKGSAELQVLRLLNSLLLRSDPRNATIPILEFLEFHDWRIDVIHFPIA